MVLSVLIFYTDCPKLDNITNGKVTTDNGTSTGQIATYSCDTEYDLVGDSERICLDIGRWNASEPSCTLKSR